MDCKTIEINGTIIKGDRILKSPVIQEEDLKEENGRRPIGVGSLSSFDGTFTDEKIIVQAAGFGEYILAQIGDVREAIELFKHKLENKELTFEIITSAVFEVVDEYFGRFENASDRMTFYKDESTIKSNESNKISRLKGKNSAMCVERAALSQNLLKSIGINSIFKSSMVIVNNKRDQHAYNLVEYDGKYYIFDSTIPTLRNGLISPIIAEISKEAFDSMSMPLIDGFSIETSHFNPLRNVDYNITYDTLWNGPREKITIVDAENAKKL